MQIIYVYCYILALKLEHLVELSTKTAHGQKAREATIRARESEQLIKVLSLSLSLFSKASSKSLFLSLSPVNNPRKRARAHTLRSTA